MAYEAQIKHWEKSSFSTNILNEAEQVTVSILFPIHAGSFIPNLFNTYIVIY